MHKVYEINIDKYVFKEFADEKILLIKKSIQKE